MWLLAAAAGVWSNPPYLPHPMPQTAVRVLCLFVCVAYIGMRLIEIAFSIHERGIIHACWDDKLGEKRATVGA